MAWVAVENFNSYTDSTDLAGLTGGSGWADAWVNRATNLIYARNAASYEGGMSARTIAGSNTFYTRDLTTGESGSGKVHFAMMKTANNSGINSFSLRSSTGSGTNRASVNLDASGNITVGSATLLAGYSANTWYLIRITYDCVAGTYTGAYYNAGWSSETASQSMGTTNVTITKVGIGGDGGTSTDYLDLITPDDPVLKYVSVSDTLKLGETISLAKIILLSVSDTLKLGETINTIKGIITSVSDTLHIGDLISEFKKLWDNDTKPSNSYSNDTKPTNSWTNDSK